MASRKGPSDGVLASRQGEEDPEDSVPCGRRSRGWSRRRLSLLKRCGCPVNQALSLTAVLHILMCFLPLQRAFLADGESWVRCVSSHRSKTWVCCSAGRWPLCAVVLSSLCSERAHRLVCLPCHHQGSRRGRLTGHDHGGC